MSVELSMIRLKVKVDSLRPHGLLPTRLPHPWDFPGKSAGLDCHFLLQGIFPTQESNPGLPHCGQTLYHLSQQGACSELLLCSATFWLRVWFKRSRCPFWFSNVPIIITNRFHYTLDTVLHVKSFNRVPFIATLWTIARQAPLSMRFSRQEY